MRSISRTVLPSVRAIHASSVSGVARRVISLSADHDRSPRRSMPRSLGKRSRASATRRRSSADLAL
ncbi:MAG: hypothetical protein U1E65_21100 [Myxococcota bacterium]